MDNRRKIMRIAAILTLLVLLFVLPPAQAQDVDCGRESVIASFAQATDMATWVQPYSVCPSQVRRAVRELAVAYELLGSVYLPFAAADDPLQFAPIWQWYPGRSVSMVYSIDPTSNTLTLIAESLTEQRDTITSAPVLAYAVSGDVTAQVKLTIAPLNELHGAGMGIRAAQDENSWVRIARVGDHVEVVSDVAGISTLVTSLPYEGGQDVYLRIERVGEAFTFAYSVNGNDWRIVMDNYLQALPQETQVFLTVFWAAAEGAALAQFAEMQVDEQ
jgi:regulation of enolase protein 1 (concanavalin A-like superfamily)